MNKELIAKQEKIKELEEKRFITRVRDVFGSLTFDVSNSVQSLAKTLKDRLDDYGRQLFEVGRKVETLDTDSIREEVQELKEIIKKKDFRGPRGIDGRDGKDGKNGLNGTSLSSFEVRQKLESLTGDDRLDAKYIKGLNQFVTKIYNGFTGGSAKGRGNVKFWGQYASSPTVKAIDGDEYWNTTNTSLYKYISGTWTQIQGGTPATEGIGYWTIGTDFVVS